MKEALQRPWQLLEIADTGGIALVKRALSVKATVTRPTKVIVVIQRNGVQFYENIAGSDFTVYSDRLLAQFGPRDLTLSTLRKFVTPEEAREIIALYFHRKNDLMRIIPKGGSNAEQK